MGKRLQMKTKTCSKCKETKPPDEFHNKKGAKDGKFSQCKACIKKYQEGNKDYSKKYRQENKDKIKAFRKEYRKENRDKIKAQKKEYYERNSDKL